MTTRRPRPEAVIRTTAGWQVLLGLYVALTVWIVVGPGLVPEQAFSAWRNVGYVAVMVVGCWVLRDAFSRSWRTTKQRPLLAAGAVLLGLALMGVSSAASQSVVLVVGSPAAGDNQAAIEAEVLVASSSPLAGLLFVAVGGVVAPVVEELVFRELPFGRLGGSLPTHVAFVVSCLAFGLIHLRGMGEWPLGVLYVGYSAALATAYLVSRRNLLVSVAAHVLWNGTGLAYLLVTAPAA